jgi:hypothetical protein
MAKANNRTEEEKSKRGTRKKADGSAAAESHADAAPNKKGGTASKKASAKATAAGDDAKASNTSAASKSADEKAAAKKPQASTTATATNESPSSSGTGAGTIDAASLPAQRGKIGVFGGPKDRGIKPDDKLALPTGKHFTFERVRSLNPKGFYCAMRWDYHVLGKSIGEGQRWWANKKLLVTNPANGAAVVVRAVDFGPPESTGLAIAVSPGAAEALGVNVGDEVEIAFADPRQPAGVVE